jgi:hypothetical protein
MQIKRTFIENSIDMNYKYIAMVAVMAAALVGATAVTADSADSG